MDFFIGVYRSRWIRSMIYIIAGIIINTAPPHVPTFSGNVGLGVELHSLIQYVISVGLWPLSLWHPTFTIGEWTGL